MDAMERDMGTSLATKSDLQLLEQRLETVKLSLEKDMELLSNRLTIRLGSMLIVGIGLLFAALELT